MTSKTKILTFAFLSALVACTQNKKHRIKMNDTQSYSKKSSAYETLLYGEWTIGSEVSSDGMMYTCNACPKTEFYANNTTNFDTSREVVRQFKVEKDILYISRKSTFISDTVNWVTDLKYQIIITGEDANSISIELKHTEKGHYSMLYREKSRLYFDPGLNGKANRN